MESNNIIDITKITKAPETVAEDEQLYIMDSHGAAKLFEVRHSQIVQDIVALDCSVDFRHTNYYRDGGVILMTGAGLMRLALCYDHPNALEVKRACLDDYNQTVKELRARGEVYKTLSLETIDQYIIQQSKMEEF